MHHCHSVDGVVAACLPIVDGRSRHLTARSAISWIVSSRYRCVPTRTKRSGCTMSRPPCSIRCHGPPEDGAVPIEDVPHLDGVVVVGLAVDLEAVVAGGGQPSNGLASGSSRIQWIIESFITINSARRFLQGGQVRWVDEPRERGAGFGPDGAAKKLDGPLESLDHRCERIFVLDAEDAVVADDSQRGVALLPECRVASVSDRPERHDRRGSSWSVVASTPSRAVRPRSM